MFFYLTKMSIRFCTYHKTRGKSMAQTKSKANVPADEANRTSKIGHSLYVWFETLPRRSAEWILHGISWASTYWSPWIDFWSDDRWMGESENWLLEWMRSTMHQINRVRDARIRDHILVTIVNWHWFDCLFTGYCVLDFELATCNCNNMKYTIWKNSGYFN